MFLFSDIESGYRFEIAFFTQNILKSIVSDNNYTFISHINITSLTKNVLSWYSTFDAKAQVNVDNVYYVCMG